MLTKMIIDEIIDSSSDNTAGTLLNENAIDNIVNSLIHCGNLTKDTIDSLIANYESESGYMIKASDFIYVLKDYITGDNLQL